jgi:hypothetical protein
MYDWLCRYLPPRWAAVFLTMWYIMLLLLVALLWSYSEAFRYGRI